jgi:hypothetical protein
MPRADPNRSDYCASRHLLRNLDTLSELRRNPLVRGYFAPGRLLRRRDAAADRRALDRICTIVRSSLARCSERVPNGSHVTLGRIHAALLRCDIDDQPLPLVAAELGLSERQLRRERRAAFSAFADAFHAAEREQQQPAAANDVATVRIAEAVELHETGQCDLALATLASIAAAAPAAERRIEALCLAAEAELEGARHAVASSHLAEARAVLRLRADELDGGTACVAGEEVDFVEWLLRWRTGVSSGFASPPPVVLSRACAADRASDEGRRALFVRASAAYAMQRWENGDRRGRDAVLRALEASRSLGTIRAKEQLATMDAEARFFALCAPPGAALARYRLIEHVAAQRGHVRAMLGARAERIACEVVTRGRRQRFIDETLHAFGSAERRTMSYTYACVARIVAQRECPGPRALAAARLTESLVPAVTAQALMARCVRVACALQSSRTDEASVLAREVATDAETVGNHRLRGAAVGYLAEIALARGWPREAQHHARQALQLLERHGTYESLKRAGAIARRLQIA